jgi:nitrate reductase (cytochrome), electron transfer subunit
MRTDRSMFLAAALLLATLAAPAAADDKKAAKAGPVKDTQLGLSKTSVFDVPAPPLYKAEDGAPGEKPLPRRFSSEIPPVIPHAIGDFLPITREANMCLECHELPGPKKKGEPTPLPRSHYVDWRHEGGKVQAKPAGARWICTACHAPQTDAKPLVVSKFKP